MLKTIRDATLLEFELPAMPLPHRPASARGLPATLPAVFAGLLALAACDQGPSTVTPYMHPSGSFDFLIAATRNEGPLYMEIDGDPFGEGEALESQVTAVMEKALQSRVLQLTTEQDAAEDPAFRLVLVFNSPNIGEVLAFCSRQPEGGPPTSAERIELRAGFCRGDDLLAAVDGWVEDAAGTADPRFEQLMRQVVRDLFTRRRSDD
ncbi:MAG: hypothetical protein GEU89_14070 [Kiloniellaceae bacterium]|nr:hypothetical protein [Kiloniellaceae bacterium]